MIDRLLSIFRKNKSSARSGQEVMTLFRKKYTNFKSLLESNSELLKMISDIEEKLTGQHVFGMSYIRSQSARIVFHAVRMVRSFEELSGARYQGLLDRLDQINNRIKEELEHKAVPKVSEYVLPYARITKETIDFTGGKNANLGEVQSRVHLPIPKGFAITTTAYTEFIESNQLTDEIRKQKMQLKPEDAASLIEVSENIQRLFMMGLVPKTIECAIFDAYTEFIDSRGPGRDSIKVSLRSSAIGEDSELSFAGQYLTILNVPSEHIVRDYKRVLASLFTPRAIAYRLHMGIPFEEAAMSVACLEMIASEASGVMYSRHPFNLTENHIIINAVWGLGTYAVDGVVPPDTYTLSKDSTPKLIDKQISLKPIRMITRSDGYVTEQPVNPENQNLPCLTDEEAITLAEYALKLEDHYQCAQDIEWAKDRNGNLLILQSRPLRLEGNKECAATEPVDGYNVLIWEGSIASPGVGFGPAYIVRSDEDLTAFPPGAVLVAAHSSPKFVIVMQKAQAIVTNSGSVTGHMASLAREFKVPALLNTQNALSVIAPGMPITVDAYAGRVYEGKVQELLDINIPKGAFMKDSPVFQSLKNIANLIVPLNLVNPKSPDFTPEACRTVHDIMRLLHEWSYAEIFQLSDITTNEGNIAVKLDASLPIDLYIIDLGGGIDHDPITSSRVKTSQITSVPFKSLLDGMLHEDLRHSAPRPVNIGGFFSVMSEQMLSPHHAGSERFGDKSYAIISDKYLNFSSRVGYHYSVLDAYCGQTPNKNYINFQFKGGAADEVRRSRRARLIQKILETMGFLIEVQADRVTARLAKQEPEIVAEKLDQLGRLLIFTRQMDMLMHSEETVTYLAQCFLTGNYHFDLSQLSFG